MMRSRTIRPGIATNETLAALGPYATLLFERLWMLADREGRLEDRPARIKAEAFPHWPEVPVENLLITLAESGLITRYTVKAYRCILICTFKKHQHPHTHEAKSTLPPPPANNRKFATSHQDTEVSNVMTCNTNGEPRSTNGEPCQVVILNPSEEYTAIEENGVGGESERGKANASPPLKRERKKPKPEPAPPDPQPLPESLPPPEPPPPAPPPHSRKPPARSPANPARRKPPARAPVAPKQERRRASNELAVCRSGPEADWWPHKPEDVRLIRDSLHDLAVQVRMPPPDDGIVRRVLDAARGAPGDEIHGVLVALYKRHKFRAMYSWGFLPIVLNDWFRAA